MKFSVVNYQEVNFGDRIDAEYFEPTYLSLESTLQSKNVFPLRKFVQLVSSAFYPAATHLYEIGEVPFIRCVDCVNYPVITPQQNDLFERIPQSFIDEYRNVQTLKENEIVLTKVGTPCYASIVSGINDVALSRTVLGVKNIQGINPFYLTAFLRSKYGFQQLYRQRELTIQYQLTLDRVYKVLIYKPVNENFEKLIAATFKLSQEIVNQSKSLYQQAEQTLLAELGLLNWRPQHQLSFVANYSDVDISSRWDSDYYHPKYTTMLEYLHSLPHETLNNIANFSNGATPLGANYLETGIPFLRIQNVGVNRLILDDVVFIDRSIHNSALQRSQLKPGDVLITITGRIGTASVIPDDLTEANINQHSVRLRIKNPKIKPYYLAAFLNCMAGRLQTEREAYGTTRDALPYYCLQKIVVPMIDLRVQDQVTDIILDAQQKNKTAQKLLDIAKFAVEMAIEQDEVIGESWLRQEMEKLDASV